MKKWLPKYKKTILFLLPALFFFALGCFSMYMVLRGKVEQQGHLTQRILLNCVGSLKASDQINKSCIGAYNTAATCVSNIKSCDIKKESKKLVEYNSQRQIAEKELQNYIIETGNIVQDAKRILQK